MPSVPIVTPSEMAIVFISIGTPPAALTPSLTACASVRRPRLHGIVSIHVLAIRIIGFLRSSSVRPMPLSIARAPARSTPSSRFRLMCRTSNAPLPFAPLPFVLAMAVPRISPELAHNAGARVERVGASFA